MNIVEYLSYQYKLLRVLHENDRKEWLTLLHILTRRELGEFRNMLVAHDNSIAKAICIQKVDELLLSAFDCSDEYLKLSQDELQDAFYETVLMEYFSYMDSIDSEIEADMGWKLIVNKNVDEFSLYFSMRFIPSVNSILRVMEDRSDFDAIAKFHEWDNKIQRQFKELWAWRLRGK